MRKTFCLMVVALLIVATGCVMGRRCERGVIRNGVAAGASRFQSLQETDPYAGAPVYMVNGGPNPYSARFGRPCLNAPGLLGDQLQQTDSWSDQNPIARNLNARNVRAGGIRSGAIDRNRLFGNGLGGNGLDAYSYQPLYTPTRSPRDFLAPNPPTIGE